MNLEGIKTRQQAFDVLQGYSINTYEGLGQNFTRQPLIKSYMLETVSHNGNGSSLVDVFAEAGQTLTQLDDTLYTVFDQQTKEIKGLVEQRIKRFPTIYTHEASSFANGWVHRIVNSTSKLDQLWISGMSFDRMLRRVIKELPGYRYCRVVFQHTKVFEQNESSVIHEEDINFDHFIDNEDIEENHPDIHRGTRVSISERLDIISEILPQLKEIYAPFRAFSQFRFPARVGNGGHDLYFDGKITNRSNSFEDHRNHIEIILEFYRRTTEEIEKITWHGVERTKLAKNQSGEYLIGAPVIFEFDKPLSQQVYDKFISSTFGRKYNKFRLWGNPIQMGVGKVHVYALDRHLWQPLFLEITTKKIVVMVPQGTCGNTVHRLVTNIQQYLDPKVNVWIGNYNYSDIIKGDKDIL